MIYFPTMLLKLLACEVFTREICFCMANTPHVIDLEFTPVGSHDHPEILQKTLQNKIQAADESKRGYDAILLCFGLCGNAIAGLTAGSTQLVVPRAHDCATILLGSKSLFNRHFGGSPSMPFSSRGHVERNTGWNIHHLWTQDEKTQLSEYAKRYGEESAHYIYEAMNPHVKDKRTDKVVYITIPQTESGECIRSAREKAAVDDKEFLELTGSLALMQNLMDGNWYPNDFLVVKPCQTVRGIYDRDIVINAAR
jgi:hypothetical protein